MILPADNSTKPCTACDGVSLPEVNQRRRKFPTFHWELPSPQNFHPNQEVDDIWPRRSPQKPAADSELLCTLTDGPPGAESVPGKSGDGREKMIFALLIINYSNLLPPAAMLDLGFN
ncbi:hypothetical protein Bbelb_357870 [Branchiostoma belcheri]|nr:hypothetical protein Bbelb_357870 [Branchiostoma belcheri]